jgi:hypothetical protein
MKFHGQKYLALLALIPTLSFAQCDVVVSLFNQDICHKELTTAINENNFFQKNNSIALQRQTLVNLIKNVGAENLLSKYDYLPTEDEVDSYIAFLDKSESSSKIKNAKLIETIEFLLANFQYGKFNKRKLESSLNTFKERELLDIKIAQRAAKYEAEQEKKFNAEETETLKAHERKFMSQIVKRWKMNKALFENYGGRIIFQQAGLEPIDAFGDFLKDIEQKGQLKIHNESYKDIFKEYHEYISKTSHRYLPEKDMGYFLKPIWELYDFEQSLKDSIAEYENIPRL